VDVGLGEPTLATQAGEDLVQAVGEGLEHNTSLEVTGAGLAAPPDSQGIETTRSASQAAKGWRTASATTPASPITKAVPQSAQAHSGHSPPSSVCPSRHVG